MPPGTGPVSSPEQYTFPCIEALLDWIHGPVTAAYVHGSDTSQEAASTIQIHLARLESRVFDFLQARGERGATDEEIQQGLGMVSNTERPRRVRLVELRLVEDSGERRKNLSGRRAAVWRVRRERA